MTTKKEAKFFRDKFVLDDWKEMPKEQAIKSRDETWVVEKGIAAGLDIDPENYDKIIGKPKPKRKTPMDIFSLRGQANEFYRRQPFFYDKSGMFWLWNLELEFYERINRDEELLHLIHTQLGVETINSKSKSEIMNALKQVGITKIPKETPKSYIQFKNGIIDISKSTNELIIPHPKYFITNPIPWELHDDEETLHLDKLFEDWVGKEDVKRLYQIIAYCLLPDYPLQRLFCFIGDGLNGKSCFLNIVRKFLGDHNVTSTDLNRLLVSRFESTRLHKKLCCFISETNFNEMKYTSILKQLTGNDLMSFEHKGKDNFDDVNYAKILIATNNLPETPDDSDGFYRRWSSIAFPNTFSEKKDIMASIPDEEYQRLASKSIQILTELLSKKEFHNEGTIALRRKIYDAHSNPMEKFIKEFTEEDFNSHIWKFEFEKKLNDWCRENRYRHLSEVAIGKKMKTKGFTQEKFMSDEFPEGQQKQIR